MPFRRLLRALVERTDGALGAIFCDHQGEHVSLALAERPVPGCAPLSEWDLKICGAQVAASIVTLNEAAHETALGSARELRVVCEAGTLACHLLPQGYYLLVVLAPGGRSARVRRELAETALLVSKEM